MQGAYMSVAPLTYVLITPLTGLGAPQGLAGWESGVFAAEIPKFSSGWDPETP